MPRPRTVPDAEILVAVRRLMGELGPKRFTLAAVARAVGLAPATLVQRFGSKRKLLLQLAEGGGADPSTDFVAAIRQKHRSPLAQLREFLACFAAMAPTPAELANHLAFLQIDLTDPAFHRITLDVARGNERAARELVEAAVAAGELRAPNPATLARVLLAVSGGSLLNWGIFRTGTARKWLLRDIDAALAPYRTATRR